MKVLVTGGMGYVGSWLVPQLLGEGHEVTVYDIGWFGDGYLPRENANCKLVHADIRDLPRSEGTKYARETRLRQTYDADPLDSASEPSATAAAA